MHYQSKYLHNYYSIKKFDDNYYKLVIMKRPIKNSVEEEVNDTILSDVNNEYQEDIEEYPKREDREEKKLDNNVIRARTTIFEYAYCNDFDYFVTLTLDPNKYDRTNLKQYIKDFGQTIRDYRKKYGYDIQYLLIPELHKDNVSWHMHGLMKGIPPEQLSKNKNGYLDWEIYSNKFGYISLGSIKNKEASAKYITKYITKSLESQKSVTEKNKKLYYVTRGLKKANKIKVGTLTANEKIPLNTKYENDYCIIYELNKLDYDLINYILK